jgi:hypothetical protein
MRLDGAVHHHRPSTCASAASVSGSQNAMSMARYISIAVDTAACSPPSRTTARCVSLPWSHALSSCEATQVPHTPRATASPSHAHLSFPRLLRFFSRGVQWRRWCGVPCSADVCRVLPRPWQGARHETRPHPGAPEAFTGLCDALRCPPCGPSLRTGERRDPGRPSS